MKIHTKSCVYTNQSANINRVTLWVNRAWLFFCILPATQMWISKSVSLNVIKTINFPQFFSAFHSHHRGQREIGLHSSVPSWSCSYGKFSHPSGDSYAMGLNWRVGCTLLLCTFALKPLGSTLLYNCFGIMIF